MKQLIYILTTAFLLAGCLEGIEEDLPPDFTGSWASDCINSGAAYERWGYVMTNSYYQEYIWAYDDSECLVANPANDTADINGGEIKSITLEYEPLNLYKVESGDSGYYSLFEPMIDQSLNVYFDDGGTVDYYLVVNVQPIEGFD